MTPLNRHHLAYDRVDWFRPQHLRKIRTHKGMILNLPMIEIHRPLHANIRQGVPIPSQEAAEAFNDTVLPYREGQALFHTVDQAIGFFAMVDEQPTAEHLYEQKQFILGRLALKEAA
jgi:hypothetical protein